MRSIVSRLSLAMFLLSWGVASDARGQEKLVLDPAKPKTGQPFKVALSPTPQVAPAESEYTWQVEVRDADGKSLTDEEVTGKARNDSSYTIPAVGKNLSYYFVLLRKPGGATAIRYELRAESGSSVLLVTASPPAEVHPATVTGSTPAVPAAPSSSDAGELAKMGARLEAAKTWAQQIVLLPKSENLVVPVEFFQRALAKRADGQEGITEFAHRQILDAAELHRAMYSVANRFPAETAADSFIDAWHSEKDAFLKALVEKNAATSFIAELWNEFVARWEREVVPANKERFREALLQAPLIVTGLLLDFEKKHIEAALTGGPPAGIAARAASSGSAGYGMSHAAVHHARTMSRIRYRHERRFARIGY